MDVPTEFQLQSSTATGCIGSGGSGDIQTKSKQAACTTSAAVPCAGRLSSSFGSSRSGSTPKSLGASSCDSPFGLSSMRRLGRLLKRQSIPTLEHPAHLTQEQLAGSADSGSSMCSTPMTQNSSGSETAKTELGEELLGTFDAQLVGQGWTIPVHQCAPSFCSRLVQTLKYVNVHEYIHCLGCIYIYIYIHSP